MPTNPLNEANLLGRGRLNRAGMIRLLSIIVGLALGACAHGTDPPPLAQANSAEIEGSAPDLTLLTPMIAQAFKNAKFAGYPRVSAVRTAPISALGDWIVCLTSDSESDQRIYALFIRDNAIVDARLAVVIDACTDETFAPLPSR
ncbi:MAG TPA: hypothetical protein VKW08_26125 [Xanthobacteraceae bacterium]|nr:hypothetical protein [Xanthobacteraceae bacterium]